MTTTVEAIYEQGVLRLAHTIPLAEGTRVEVTVNVPEPISIARSPAELLAAIAAMPPADMMDAIAAMPLETEGVEFSSRDHDRILYGSAGAK